MAAELIPLKPDQHSVTFVPKTTTDLPFFNLTYRKKDIPTEIEYEGIDEAGHPIYWRVEYNTSKRTGAPGVEAHEVWYLLIKPAIDANRNSEGAIPQIIPLGGMRECLRMVGWTAGGFQAKELIKSLTQISFAGCVADLWFPTDETDAEGKQKYLQVKSRFSRLSVYAIGEHHVTEEELKTVAFDFDLEDKLYIRLDPIEVKLQQLQANQQRLIDNAYMFSIKPIARRWYELLAGKIYGTLKHNAPYFEIRYSWYVKHHHTLKRFVAMKRVTEQMNRVVQEHLDSGFLTKVEYRKIKEPEQEQDFLIRYFLGAPARQSINRIQGHMLNRRKREAVGQVSIKEGSKLETAKIDDLSLLKTMTDTELPLEGKEAAEPANFQPDEVSATGGDRVLRMTTLETHLLGKQREAFGRLTREFLITETKAYELVKKHPVERITGQIEAFAHREESVKSNKAGFLIRAIEENYSFPENYLTDLKDREVAAQRVARQERIENCPICDDRGWRNVRSERDTHYGVMHECTHDKEIESRFEDHNV
jgi:hypothetical protein